MVKDKKMDKKYSIYKRIKASKYALKYKKYTILEVCEENEEDLFDLINNIKCGIVGIDYTNNEEEFGT
tara:strand:+ start:510 stop:713 length:204 start_codon:yes stop_codon:yes gene_type:complete